MNAKILGIINLSHNSFYKPSAFKDIKQAAQHAKRLVMDGAYAIDIGAQASNPDAKKITSQQELAKLIPLIKELKKNDILVSIDSFERQTQQECLSQGINFINDIQGFGVEKITPDVLNSKCKIIIMHSIQQEGIADKRFVRADKIIDSIYNFFDQRLAELSKKGLSTTRLILDPGMGFFLGSDPMASLKVLKELTTIKKKYKMPILISVSRKSFLRNITNSSLEQSLAPTLAAELFCLINDVDYIRTHDVKSITSVWKMWQSLTIS